jgi:hypothetical protein
MEIQINLQAEVEDALDPSNVGPAVTIQPIAVDSPRVLSEELIRLPGDLARFNRVYALVLKAHRVTKRKKSRVESERAAWHREHAEKPPSGRITDAYIQALAETDPQVIDVQDELDEIEDWKTQLSGIVDAIRAKQRDLEAVGYLMQAEIRSGHLAGGADPQSDEAREHRIWPRG